jgi:hypothetical protein
MSPLEGGGNTCHPRAPRLRLKYFKDSLDALVEKVEILYKLKFSLLCIVLLTLASVRVVRQGTKKISVKKYL